MMRTDVGKTSPSDSTFISSSLKMQSGQKKNNRKEKEIRLAMPHFFLDLVHIVAAQQGSDTLCE
jgi:hypothetical protein